MSRLVFSRVPPAGQTGRRVGTGTDRSAGDCDLFLCPACAEFNTAVNPRTNLGRCFRCERNFNAIELAMSAKKLCFLAAVQIIEDLLPGA